ncbi:MAG: hypothetical protein H0W72_11795, partial [Planctomycetes bacterium]|nr:hypothetical protein [Planctomycetota bacterium]
LRHADQLVRGDAVALDRAALSDLPLDGLGDLSWTSSGVRSSAYGTRRFLTPIAELSIEQVGKPEAEAYQRFLDRYQDGWRNVFDPIALRVSRRANGLGADLTVMPLILGTDYRQLIEVAGASTIAPGAGDPHDALIHAVFAVDRQSRPVRDIANFATGMGLRVDPLGWLGSSVAVWADPDPFWDEFVRDSDPSSFLERAFYRLPVALRAESNDALKLAAFLTALRAMAEQSAPGMTTWETRTWRDQGYVRVGPAAGAREAAGDFAEGALYYAATPDALLVSFNEDVIKRAIDRAKAPPAVAPTPWLGANTALRLEPGVMAMQRALGRSFDGGLADAWTGRSWSNLPILGEWRQRWPDLDPLVVHERLFGARPLCPGGGAYAWNADWATMASTVYGHPGEPKDGPSLPPALADLARASFGLTFEHDGLRARVELERTPPSK